jgi:hypothetical protein
MPWTSALVVTPAVMIVMVVMVFFAAFLGRSESTGAVEVTPPVPAVVTTLRPSSATTAAVTLPPEVLLGTFRVDAVSAGEVWIDGKRHVVDGSDLVAGAGADRLPDGTAWAHVHVAPTGVVWAEGRTASLTLWSFDGDRWIAHPLPSLVSGPWWVLGAGPAGAIWVAGVAEGQGSCAQFDVSGGAVAQLELYRYDGATWTYLECDEVPPVLAARSAGAVGPDGELWLAAPRIPDAAPPAAGAAGEGVPQAVLRDLPVGLFRLDREGWQEVPVPEGCATLDLSSEPRFAVAPDGALWLAASCVARFDGTAWTTFEGAAALSRNESELAITPDVTVWLATGTALVSFDGDEWTRHLGEDVISVNAAPDGAVWVVAGDRTRSAPVAGIDSESYDFAGPVTVYRLTPPAAG